MDSKRIRHMAEIVKTRLDKKPILVLSAMGDTTDHLLKAGEDALKNSIVNTAQIEELHTKTILDLGLGNIALEGISPLFAELQNLLMGISLIKELTGRTRDYLVSFGERLSIRIVAGYFTAIGIKTKALDAWEAGFISNSNFTNAELTHKSWELIPRQLLKPMEDDVLQIVTGFLAKDEKGNITTLGRGGSDLTATTIAAACNAEEVQIWKDVDGILTADPRIVEKARVLETISYEVAAELAYYGAQVLHPRAMMPCIKTGTPVVVKNSYNPDSPGTKIVRFYSDEKSRVQAITSRKNVTLINIISSHMLGQYGFLAEVFNCFANHHISVDMVATSEVSISITLDDSYDLSGLKNDLSKIATVEIKTGKSIITVVGDVSDSADILVRSFNTCKNTGSQVQMISYGASMVNISFIVDGKKAAEIVKGLHKDFFESDQKTTGSKTKNSKTGK